MSKLDKVLVLGSNSFSGASFVKTALSKGAQVIGISRSKEPHAAFLPYKWAASNGDFHFHQLDLNKDLDAIIELTTSQKTDYFVNFAAQSMVGESWENPEDWFRTNALSTVKLHNRLRMANLGLKKYVHITTPEVYGSTNGWINEDAPYNPSTPYAASRAAGDMSLKTFVDAYDFPAVSTRAANVYGAGQQLYRIIPRAIIYIRLGKTLQLHGGGHSQRSFIHIDDVSDATWKIMKNGVIGESYHISTNQIVAIRDLVEIICDKMGVRLEDSVELVGERMGKDAAYKLDSSKIRDTLGWSDQTTLEAGLEQCINWVDDNLEALKAQNFNYKHKP